MERIKDRAAALADLGNVLALLILPFMLGAHATAFRVLALIGGIGLLVSAVGNTVARSATERRIESASRMLLWVGYAAVVVGVAAIAAGRSTLVAVAVVALGIMLNPFGWGAWRQRWLTVGLLLLAYAIVRLAAG